MSKDRMPAILKPKKSLLERINEAENSFLKNADEVPGKIVFDTPLDMIQVKENVRKTFDEENIKQLAQNIKETGLLQPIVIKKAKGEDFNYELVVGENRLRAFKLLGRKKIPAIIKNDEIDENKTALIQLSENIKRKNLNPIETAEALDKIRVGYGLKQKELSEKIGLALDTIKKYSQMSRLSNDEKLAHIKNKSSFDAIMSYIVKKSAVTALSDKAVLKKSETGPLIASNNEQLSLFTTNKQGLKMKAFSLNFKKETREDIESKINQCEAFIAEAKKQLGGIKCAQQ